MLKCLDVCSFSGTGARCIRKITKLYSIFCFRHRLCEYEKNIYYIFFFFRKHLAPVVLASTNVNKTAIKIMQLSTRKPGSLVFSWKGYTSTYVCICMKLVFFPSKHIFISYYLLKFCAECGFIFKGGMSSSHYWEKKIY